MSGQDVVAPIGTIVYIAVTLQPVLCRPVQMSMLLVRREKWALGPRRGDWSGKSWVGVRQGHAGKAASRFRAVQVRLSPGGGSRGPALEVVDSGKGSGQVIRSRLSHNHTQSQHFITADSASHVGGRQVKDVDRRRARLERPGEEKE